MYLIYALLIVCPALASGNQRTLADFITQSEATLVDDGYKEINVPRKDAIRAINEISKEILGTEEEIAEEDLPFFIPGLVTTLKKVSYHDPLRTIEFQFNLLNPKTRETVSRIFIERWQRSRVTNELELWVSNVRIEPDTKPKILSVAREVTNTLIRFAKKYGGKIRLDTMYLGRYQWATLGYQFRRKNAERDRNQLQGFLQSFLERRGIPLQLGELQLFVEPYHFVALTDGRIHDFYNLDYPKLGINSAKGHLGKNFLLQAPAWDGEINPEEQPPESEAARFREAYPKLREESYRVLSEAYQQMIERIKAKKCGKAFLD